MVEQTSTTRKRAKWLERVRHVAWAGLIALVLLITTVLDPIDQVIWATESRLSSRQASGEIVFVGTNSDLTDPDTPQARRQLANLVTRLDEAGVERLYIDFAFDQATDPATDANLNAALQSFSGEAVLVDQVSTGLDGQPNLVSSRPSVSDGVERVASDFWMNYLGHTWYMPYTVSYGEATLANLPADIARVSGKPGDIFLISYDFALDSIPSYRFENLADARSDLEYLSGKTVLIGPASSRGAQPRNVPGLTGVSRTLIAVFAAETLEAGAPQYVGGLPVLLAALAALLAASSIGAATARRLAYSAIGITVLVGPLFTPQLNLRISAGYALAVVFAYMFYRARARWKRNLLLVDPETNLPTFAALETDKATADNVPAIIVARIHRFEEVRRTLPVELHADYLLAITGRLKAATQDATIYLGQGHLIAWTMKEKDPALLREHLEGLRALFASPLIVGDQQVDVGITFGIDITPSPNVARRLAAAIAVAEKTTETFEPIAIADTTSQEDLIWNISLQARIDAALSNGEIYLAYQPKIMVQTGEIVGAEALVRWKDPIRGHIPPDSFIRQCETAGRMSQLTRFVLEEACKAGLAFEKQGLHLPIAVNISATLLHERSIVTMVSDVLERTAFDPRRLTLEITETYRISNLDLAAEILGELKALGTKISMDDFGVGAASLEALLRLPFSELKIDRMFIAPMTNDPKALGIVKSVLQMGKDLRIIVVAEGVEDAGTLTLLRDSGCVVAQGFAISRPVTFDKILEYHRDSEKPPKEGMV